MPEPKDAKSLLTATERERLINRTPDRNMSETDKEKHRNSIYHNDMVVRDKVGSWLKKSEDILFALEHLPTRKLKKEINDDDIYKLLNVGLKLLEVLDFAPVESVGGQAVIAKHTKTESDKLKDVWMRPATEIDFKRNLRVWFFGAFINKFVSKSPIFEEYIFKRLSEVGPDFGSYHEKEENEGKYKMQIMDYDKNLELDPNNIELLGGKVICLANIGQFEDSINYFDKIKELDPLDERAWIHKAILLKHMNRPLEARDEAIKYFDKALEIDPSDVEVWLAKASLFAEEGYESGNKLLLKEALKSINKAIKLEPKNEYLFATKARVLRNLGKKEEAIKYYDEALSINPENATTLNNKGVALKNLNKIEAALECYEKALNIDPKYADAWFNRGLTLLELNEPEKAKACFKETLKIDHSKIDNMFAKGEALLKEGYKREGESYLAKVREIKELIGS
jgi:tetratricopeptide (TPR) repeat protein